jgi:hypothetical protein
VFYPVWNDVSQVVHSQWTGHNVPIYQTMLSGIHANLADYPSKHAILLFDNLQRKQHRVIVVRSLSRLRIWINGVAENA